MKPLLALVLTAGVCCGPLGASTSAARKYLLLDTRLWSSSQNLAVEAGRVKKAAANPLFGEEYPWEPRFDNMYPNVRWDREQGIYQCWYNLFTIFRVDAKASTPDVLAWSYRESGVAYATSPDGIAWSKPLRADLPFDGSPSNVVLRDAHGVGVFKDARESDPAKRYKSIFRREERGESRSFAVAFSPDGIHWSARVDIPNIRLRADTHNNALWAPTLGKYVAITRDWGPAMDPPLGHVASGIPYKRAPIRLAARTESADFIHWADSKIVLRGSDDAHQVYAMPICCYEGVYLGFPVILDIKADRAHPELAWSPDTVHWTRISPGRALIENGAPGSYDWGCVYPSPPVIGEKEIRIYYGGSDRTHTGPRRTHLAFATLRPDGFAGAEPIDPARPGELTTVPLEGAAGKAVRCNAEVEPGGSIQAIPLEADSSGRCRIHFILTRAKLYSFEF